MKSTITIDLDYWTNTYTTVKKEAVAFIKKCSKKSKKTFLIFEHHDILGVLPKGTEKIVNVDFHNDIIKSTHVRNDRSLLNEGTWGNFLPRSVKEFEWCYPIQCRCILDGEGICEVDDLPEDDYPIKYKETYKIKNLKLQKEYEACVICVSDDWDSMCNVMKYLEVLMPFEIVL